MADDSPETAGAWWKYEASIRKIRQERTSPVPHYRAWLLDVVHKADQKVDLWCMSDSRIAQSAYRASYKQNPLWWCCGLKGVPTLFIQQVIENIHTDHPAVQWSNRSTRPFWSLDILESRYQDLLIVTASWMANIDGLCVPDRRPSWSVNHTSSWIA